LLSLSVVIYDISAKTIIVITVASYVDLTVKTIFTKMTDAEVSTLIRNNLLVFLWTNL
jgi:hypothetical protein